MIILFHLPNGTNKDIYFHFYVAKLFPKELFVKNVLLFVIYVVIPKHHSLRSSIGSFYS